MTLLQPLNAQLIGPENGSGLVSAAEKTRIRTRCHRFWARLSEHEKIKLFSEICEPEKYQEWMDLISSKLPEENDDPVLRRLDKIRKEATIQRLGKEALVFKTKYLAEVRKLRDEGGATSDEIATYLKEVRNYKVTARKLEKFLTAFDALQG